jgi:hypothetical protein
MPDAANRESHPPAPAKTRGQEVAEEMKEHVRRALLTQPDGDSDNQRLLWGVVADRFDAEMRRRDGDHATELRGSLDKRDETWARAVATVCGTVAMIASPGAVDEAVYSAMRKAKAEQQEADAQKLEHLAAVREGEGMTHIAATYRNGACAIRNTRRD